MLSSQYGTEFTAPQYSKIKKVYSIWLCKNVMVCLSGENEEADDGILKLLEVLLSSEKEADEKKKILQEEFLIEMDRTFESEVQLMCNLSKDIEEKGIQKGMQKGIQEGVILSLRNLMKSMKWTKEQAMEALGIPESEREQYIEALTKQ